MSGNAKALPVVMYDMPEEKAYEAISMLTDVTKHERPHITVYAGRHETLGPVYVVMPPIGDPVILPLFETIVTSPVAELELDLLNVPTTEIALPLPHEDSPLDLQGLH